MVYLGGAVACGEEDVVESAVFALGEFGEDVSDGVFAFEAFVFGGGVAANGY